MFEVDFLSCHDRDFVVMLCFGHVSSVVCCVVIRLRLSSAAVLVALMDLAK